AVLAVLFLARRADRLLGWGPFISPPWSVLLFVVLTLAGGAIIWNAYTYLVFVGEGSPCPQYGGPKKLVRTGPYALVRHPSVIGKLSGIVGLGCLSGSCAFTFVVIPLLLAWSLYYNRCIQEQGCVDRFGREYLDYRGQVPMLIPRAVKRALLPLLGFLLVSCAVTFPVVLHLGDRVIGIPNHPNQQADIFFIETMSASLREGRYIRWFVTDRSNFPVGQTFNPRERHSLHLYLASLFRSAPQPFGTYNLAMLVFLALNGFAMYLLAREFFASRAVSFASGILFMLNSYTLVKATIGSLQKVALFWLPLYMVFLLRLRRSHGLGDLLAALLFLQLMMLTYPVYACYALIFTAVLMAYDLVRKQRSWTFAGQAALLIGLFFACSVGVDYLLGLRGPHPVYQFFLGGGTALHRFWPGGELSPNRHLTFDILHPFNFHLAPPTDLSMGLSISLCAAALWAAMRSTGLTRFFFACAVLFIVLASGSFVFDDRGIVRILGCRIMLPHHVLFKLVPVTYGEPLLGPIRALPIAAICLALLGGTALAALAKDRGGRGRAALILCFLAVYLAELHLRFPGLFPLRVSEPRIPRFFRELRRTPGGALLNLPLTRTGHRYGFYSAVSGHKMMNPHLSDRIAIPVPAAAESLETKQEFIARLSQWDVRHIVIHRNAGDIPFIRGARWYGPMESPVLKETQWLARLCGKPVDYPDDQILVYTVP
ncbi:MAG: methyltransferase, partial [Elusimicrobia bacterium]|nr:methyltransferase [Elusimicrobiota bacterium]